MQGAGGMRVAVLLPTQEGRGRILHGQLCPGLGTLPCGWAGAGAAAALAPSLGSRLFCCQRERGLAAVALSSCGWEDQRGLAAC